jgi:hypothetical protein
MYPKEKRIEPRKQANEKVTVTDINSGRLLGNLVNISQGGFMLVSDAAPNPGQLFQLRLLLPTPILDQGHIELGAECLWCQEASDSDGYCWAGFQIIDVSEQGADLIEQLVSRWTD